MDDGRNPPDHLDRMFHTVRDFDSFREWVEVNGIPELVSFDHDLHWEHTEYFFSKGGFSSPPDPREAFFRQPTGYDCAVWLLDRCLEQGRYPRFVIVHSANPIGSDQIHELFTAFCGSHNTEIQCRKMRWGVKPRN